MEKEKQFLQEKITELMIRLKASDRNDFGELFQIVYELTGVVSDMLYSKRLFKQNNDESKNQYGN